MHSFLPAACDARLKRFADYLAQKAPPGKLPGRQHIDPFEIPDLLPYLMLYDVILREGGEPRYRTRLVGTHVVDLLGADATGKFVDDVLPKERGAEIIAQYHDIVRTKQPRYLDGELRNRGREHIRFQRIGFPLARNGEDVDMLVLVMVGFDARKLRLRARNAPKS